ncbi:uncharacterized protein EV422DRAFT_526628 [Fimicolochytrium jonesii]|uniref:uncharacterized protein n=1 Tax=Fimicolochytrium jonesii TaxID=1396493 RepID=UPI0022FE7AA0|nr:uncharacterized protein EV422DRAFT_526628 [Fimicolochytrium jonesii]KAI8821710.1 hypothetical protein EV422DRAFT_526628 [Fimicolochytrium jonesii]
MDIDVGSTTARLVKSSLSFHDSDTNSHTSVASDLDDDEDDDGSPDEADDADEEDDEDGNAGVSKRFRKKELEFMRMNKAMEARSAAVIKMAEQVMKEGKETLTRPMTAPAGGKDARISEAAEDSEGPHAKPRTVSKVHGKPRQIPSRPQTAIPSRSAFQRSSAATSATLDGNSTPSSAETYTPATHNPAGTPNPSLVPDHDDEVGGEASVRLLKARMAVMQQDMDRLVIQNTSKNDTIAALQQRIKTLESENGNLSRSLWTTDAQHSRVQAKMEEFKKRAENSESAIASLKKSLDAQTRTQRQKETEGNAKDVRLNRALDEIERRKQMAAKAQQEAKEKLEESQRTNEKLLHDLRRATKQKNDLLMAFKKQAVLCDVLKRQKIHIEAAKLLDIAEQDFMRALNWENS